MRKKAMPKKKGASKRQRSPLQLAMKLPLSKKLLIVFVAVFVVGGGYLLYMRSFAAGQPEYKSGYAGNCLEDQNGSTTNGTPATIDPCNGWARQQYTISGQAVMAKGLCMQTVGGGTPNGTKVEMSA